MDRLIEGVQEKEPNTVEVKVTKSMTKQDVVDKILQEIGGINWDTPSFSLYFMHWKYYNKQLNNECKTELSLFFGKAIGYLLLGVVFVLL